jgi:hypothetical protein
MCLIDVSELRGVALRGGVDGAVVAAANSGASGGAPAMVVDRR